MDSYYGRRGDKSQNWERHSEGGRRGRGRGGRPPGLRGKEIGLWYASRSREKQKTQDKQSRQEVVMDSQKERHISSLLHRIRAADDIAPQPSRSYRDLSPDEQTSRSNHDLSPSDLQHSNQQQSNTNHEHSPPDKPSFIARDLQKSRNNYAGFKYASYSGSQPSHTKCRSGFIYTPTSGCLGDSNDGDDDSEDEVIIEEDPVTGFDDDNDEDLDNDGDAEVSHLYHYMEEEDNDFIMEFQCHREANRRSQEDLSVPVEVTSDLIQNEAIDRRLLMELQEKPQLPRYQQMLHFRQNLPSYNMREVVIGLINSNQVVVISGETGCGKTTQVPQFILDDQIMRGQGSTCHIICTQPRRISAISVAERVADERAEACGQNNSTGYQIRLESRLPRRQGSILYCTVGIMLQWLRSDPYLCQTSHIVLDEIHERDLHSDFLMIILQDVLYRRPDLKLILMSATLNAEMFSKYFGNCPMINIPGFTFEVQEFYLEDILEMIKYVPSSEQNMRRPRVGYGRKKQEWLRKRQNYITWMHSLGNHGRYSRQTIEALDRLDSEEINLDLVRHLIEYICRHRGEGAILVFLPGWDQISKLHKLLTGSGMFQHGNAQIIPLHSMMPTVNQKEVFNRPPPGVRKIVIATNIAETSITIDDIVYVIDCGKTKMKNFDAENNITTLQPEWVSRANAKQRRGRAGRVQPGECYHVYTSYEEKCFQDYQLPEILRTRLEELCLQIKLLKLGRIEPFVSKAMQPPSLEALHSAICTLVDLNALDSNEDLTPLGYHLAKMPVDPQMGKMLLFGAMFSCLDPILTVAASLSFKDAFFIPLGKEREADQKRRVLSDGSQSDHIMLINAFKGWEKAKSRGTDRQFCWDNFMSALILKLLSDMRRQFTELLHEIGFLSCKTPKDQQANLHSDNVSVIKAALCAGLYPNVAKIKRPGNGKRPSTLLTKDIKSLRIHPKSVNEKESKFLSPWLVYHLKMKSTKIYIHDCSVVSPYPLLFFGGNITAEKDGAEDCLVVDDWIWFRASPKIATLVKELRAELDKLLEYKVTHPGPINWNTSQKEGAIMTAIIDLMSTDSGAPQNLQAASNWSIQADYQPQYDHHTKSNYGIDSASRSHGSSWRSRNMSRSHQQRSSWRSRSRSGYHGNWRAGSDY